MQKIVAATLLAAGLASGVAFAADAQPAKAGKVPAMISEAVAKAEAEVIAVDLKARKVTLKNDEGVVSDIVVGKKAVNLPQVKVGDRVIVEYGQALFIELKKSPGLRVTEERQDGVSAAPGQRPGVVAMKETHFVADIINVDTKKSMITVRGAKGRIIDMKMKDKEFIRQARVGDQVEGIYEQVVALIVLPPAGN